MVRLTARCVTRPPSSPDTADGVEHEMTAGPDGGTVSSGPTKDDEDAADRAIASA